MQKLAEVERISSDMHRVYQKPALLGTTVPTPGLIGPRPDKATKKGATRHRSQDRVTPLLIVIDHYAITCRMVLKTTQASLITYSRPVGPYKETRVVMANGTIPAGI